jgi:AraC-like DNA-binding protein
MFYHEYPPPPSLKAYLQCVWILEHDYREAFHTHEHLWADTHVELILSYGVPYYRRPDPLPSRTTHPAPSGPLPYNFVIGPSTRQLLLYSDGFTGLIAARFHPWGFAPFSRKPMTALVDQVLLANEVLGNDIPPLTDQPHEEKVRVLSSFLTNKLAHPTPSTIRPIAEAIQTGKGHIHISDLARQFSTNPRWLERHFLAEIGLPAKLFARILRFNHARQLIEQNPDIPLASLTYETGYADQAHFSKNFRELFDYTPAAYKAMIRKFMRESGGFDKDVVFLQDQ